MPENERLTNDAFLALADAAGIDVSGAHGEELFSLVQNVLAGLKALHGIETAEAEPDVVFTPPSS